MNEEVDGGAVVGPCSCWSCATCSQVKELAASRVLPPEPKPLRLLRCQRLRQQPMFSTNQIW